MKLLITWVLHATALLALAHLSTGIEISSFATAMAAALLIGFLNLFVRPALVVLTLPVTFLTLGLFLFIINALMFWAAAELLDGFKVSGFASALLGSLLYSTFCMLIDSALQHLFPPQPV
jgi:putative membrane protein